MRCNFIKLLLVGIVITGVNAKISVVKTGNILSANSDNSSAVMMRIIGPDHKVISQRTEKGNSIDIQIPANAKDGVYHYEIHAGNQFKGGMIKIRNGKVQNNMPSHKKDRK